jgi:very-short-patch-repair endonuclease
MGVLIERNLWRWGYFIGRQVRVGKYYVDILIYKQYYIGGQLIPYCAVECDGQMYHSTPKQKSDDKKRQQDIQRVLASYGYRVGFIRISGKNIYHDLQGCANDIYKYLVHGIPVPAYRQNHVKPKKKKAFWR